MAAAAKKKAARKKAPVASKTGAKKKVATGKASKVAKPDAAAGLDEALTRLERLVAKVGTRRGS